MYLRIRNLISKALKIQVDTSHLDYCSDEEYKEFCEKNENFAKITRTISKIIEIITKYQSKEILQELFFGASSKNFFTLYIKFRQPKIGSFYYSIFKKCSDDFINSFCRYDMGIFIMADTIPYFFMEDGFFKKLFYFYKIVEKYQQYNYSELPFFDENLNSVIFKTNKYTFLKNVNTAYASSNRKFEEVYSSFIENFSEINCDIIKDQFFINLICFKSEKDNIDTYLRFFKNLVLDEKNRNFLIFIYDKFSNQQNFEIFGNNIVFDGWVRKRNIQKICEIISIIL